MSLFCGADSIDTLYLGDTEVEKAYVGSELVYTKEQPTPEPENCLKLVSESSNTMTLNQVGTPPTVNLEYSLNGSTWTAWDYANGGVTWTGALYLRGHDNTGFASSTSVYNNFAFTSSVAIYGNIMYLLEYDETLTAIPATYCFCNLFNRCTSLTTTPALPATTLELSCYRSMFYGCTSLTTAPALPATTLVGYCYYYMFYGCSSLTLLPKVSATDISANNCLSNWLSNVPANGTIHIAEGMSSVYPSGASGIPSGWTVVEDA